MAPYIGNATIISFGGVTINTSYRNVANDENIELVEKSAGADTVKSYLTALKESNMKVDFLVDGTTIWAAVAPGTSGAIIYGPEGSATGKPKYTGTGIIKSRTRKNPYNDLVVATIEIQWNTAITEGVYP